MLTGDESMRLAVQSRINALYAAVLRQGPGGATAATIIDEAREFAAFIQQG
jgi:hypothetical protein